MHQDTRKQSEKNWKHKEKILPCLQSSSALWVTFAFGAFLPSPLKLASDQAVIGAHTLHIVGKKGHDSDPYFSLQLTKLFWRFNLKATRTRKNFSSWSLSVITWSQSPVLLLWQPVLSHFGSSEAFSLTTPAVFLCFYGFLRSYPNCLFIPASPSSSSSSSADSMSALSGAGGWGVEGMRKNEGSILKERLMFHIMNTSSSFNPTQTNKLNFFHLENQYEIKSFL